MTVKASLVDRLRTAIQTGELPPGTHLRQVHVAERYGVSTTPVREAFVELEREGLVRSVAHRGVVVFEPSASELMEIYEIRIPLEAVATELAVPNLTDEDLVTLKALLDAMVEVGRTRDAARAAELNMEFHMRIYRASGRARLIRMINDLRAASSAYMILFGGLQPRWSETEAEHKEIFDACVARAPKRAAKATTNHLKHTVRFVSAALGPDQRPI